MIRKPLSFFVFLLILGVILLTSCSSRDKSIVWSDDFDDGDLEGWETWWKKGFYSTDDGVLSIKTGGDLYHESTVLTGTWSFDLYLDNNLGTTHEFRFTESPFNFQNLEVKQNGTTQIWITTQRDGTIPKSSYLDLGEKVGGWHHFDISKDETGMIKVYYDGNFIFEHFDDREFDAEKLVIMYCCDGPVLDNLIVRDQIIEIPLSN
jgi:hypothetical protein